MKRVQLTLLCALATLQPSCALTSKADAMTPRFFNPQLAAVRRSQAAPRPFELRLGQVSSAAHLDERISYRINTSEVGFYDDRRWTELPEAYLRRALERELFEDRKLTRVMSGSGPVLDVELTSFEELRQSPTRVRVTLTYSLRDERRALLERSLELAQPLTARPGADSAALVAEALSATLAQAVQTVGAAVVLRLGEAPTAEVVAQ